MGFAARLTAVICTLITAVFYFSSLQVVLFGVLTTVVVLLYLCSGFAPRWVESGAARTGRGIKDILYRNYRPRDWDWSVVIPNELIVGRLPRGMDDVEELKKLGVGAVISLNEEWELLVAGNTLNAKGFKWLHLPTPDYYAPLPEDIARGVDFVHNQVALGSVVYCHCNAGRGRSALVAIAYIVSSRGMNLLEAYEFLKTKRSQIAGLPALWGLRPQWRSLTKWYSLHKGKQ